jgi:large subunit ribosomal protein L18
MDRIKRKTAGRTRRRRRVRKRVSGSLERPRLSVFRSGRHIYAQLVDDLDGRTLTSASSLCGEVRGKGGKPAEVAKRVGELLAARAKEKKVTAVVFDRGGYRYHGRVRALAEAAREGGLRF